MLLFKEDKHHFITLMNLVGFSWRGCLHVMQRQMHPVPPQVLLMFKVMQKDRLIKRRLRDALGSSLSHHDGLVTRGSRVLQPRDGGRRGKTVPKEQPPHLHRQAYSAHEPSSATLPLLSPCHRSSAEFTIIQVFTEGHLGYVLIKPYVCSWTMAGE